MGAFLFFILALAGFQAKWIFLARGIHPPLAPPSPEGEDIYKYPPPSKRGGWVGCFPPKEDRQGGL